MKRLISWALLLLASSAAAAVVLPVGTAPQLLVPVAGSAPGANGTFFRSDITIVNLASRDQKVVLQWWPQPGSGVGPVTGTITLHAQEGVRSSDFVHDSFNSAGLGSIVVTGVTVEGTPDPAAQLHVASRIWTPQPGTNGTTSQSFDAIPMSAIDTPAAELFGFGATENNFNYRVNVGIVNVDPVNAQTFNVRASAPLADPPVSVVLTIPPRSM